ncbi:Nucleotide-binding universal stress protein, UspA family [Paraburkholderia steynii]|uniref:Universal stress protein n=1 Tax=Paraburkholderia steynii TaxID=1245441 RepID=A0A7Z7FG94_9BURK|nr:universal stress protein [Paraburkholderia steynii]SDH10958.1 Nucleotide-binding universal stress protein, UspA family [Paraburkholderia steynii]
MYRKILVAVDGSHTSKLAVQEAVKMASLTSGTVHAVYVVDKSPIFNYAGYFDPTVLTDALRSDGRNALENVEATCRQSGVACANELVETEPLNDDIAQTLQRRAERLGAELVVLGTHGRRGMKRIVLGSVAEHFVRIATCPVLLVRGSDEKDEAGQ